MKLKKSGMRLVETLATGESRHGLLIIHMKGHNVYNMYPKYRQDIRHISKVIAYLLKM